MNRPSESLEHLISRVLDDEATAGQRRELNAELQRDPDAAALFETERALDREYRIALRRALGRPIVHHPCRPWWERTARNFALAAAACLTLLFWSLPSDRSTPAGETATAASSNASWFRSPSPRSDAFTTDPAALEPAVTPLQDTNADWIVIPSDKPGEFLVIEVNRVKTHMVVNQQDF